MIHASNNPEWVWFLAYLFFAIEAVICFERASQKRPASAKAAWCLLGVVGLVGNTAAAVYAHT